MGLFNWFKKKESSPSKAILELVEQRDKIMFPGGENEKRQLVSELKTLLSKRYDDSAIRGTLQYMSSHIVFSEDKSAERVVDRGALVRPHNVFSREDAMKIYRFAVRNQYRKIFPNDDDEGFQVFYTALGNNEGGATTDVIPGAYGEYGLCETNPIPVNGIPASEMYLKKLRLLSGEPITWERVCSTGAENIENPIDMYSIKTTKGEHLCDLYISPYQNVISSTPPKGFYIVE